MKHTDRFFKFPVRMYDSLEVLKADIEEEKKLEEGIDLEEIRNIQVEFLVGVKAVKPEDILGWNETLDTEHDSETVRKEGFPCTMVHVDKQGQYLCNWNRKKFEEKLNEFYEKLGQE